MITSVQKQTAMAMVNIFETGSAAGNYARVTVVAGDAGHLTYGRSQTTLASGNLFLLIRNYCGRGDAMLKDQFGAYLDRLKAIDLTLDNDMQLRVLLKEAGADPAMHKAQDDFFDSAYWQPAVNDASALNIGLALGVAVVYDSHIHGAWGRIRDQVNKSAPPPATEKDWISAYVTARKAYLLSRPDPLPQTVYRVDTFRTLIDAGNWELALPLTVRGVLIDDNAMADTRPVTFHAETDPKMVPRILHLTRPYMEGDDVKEIQDALKKNGFDNQPDSVYGPLTESLVKAFQASKNLNPDGIVGPATRSALSL